MLVESQYEMQNIASIDTEICITRYWSKQPIPVALPSKACICGRSIARVVGSNSAEYVDIFSYIRWKLCR